MFFRRRARKRPGDPAAQFRFIFIATVLAVMISIGWHQLEKAGIITPYAALANGDQVVTLRTRTGQSHTLKVEIADTPDKQREGLMFRQDMPLDHGMLFVFAKERVAEFWMRNTYISLDMIFVTGDGRIVKIHPNAIPHDLTQISSDVPVKAVLEVNAGTASRLGLSVGDKLSHPALN